MERYFSICYWFWGGFALGLILPVIWGVVFVLAETEQLSDLQSVPSILFILACMYLLTGVGCHTAITGAACGFLCAWLPQAMRLWQRVAILSVLILGVQAALFALGVHARLPSACLPLG